MSSRNGTDTTDRYEVRQEGRYWAVYVIGTRWDAFIGKWTNRDAAEEYAAFWNAEVSRDA